MKRGAYKTKPYKQGWGKKIIKLMSKGVIFK
jgi:hypothetical protein